MASTKWKTQYDRKREFYASPGSAIVKKFSSRLDKDGNVEVYEDGEKDLYAYIQSFAEMTDINNVIARYAATGDESILNKNPGAYLDLSNLPDNFIDMINEFRKAENLFNDLDPEIKEKFDNNVNRFLASVGTDEWIQKLGLDQISNVDQEPAVEDKESEV